MPCIRLNPSASVTPTDAGVILRSDLGTFQVVGSDVRAFLDRMVPLLDGSHDRDALHRALGDYSRTSVTALLDLLQSYGLIEAVPDAEGAAERERWRGQLEFFRTWSSFSAPDEAMRRLASARVLIAGLEPWGATAAIELAAAGVGALFLVDDDGARREAAAALAREAAPQLSVAQSAMSALDGGDSALLAEPWSLVVAAVAPGDAERLERVARFAHRAKVVSLWSHLAGKRAVLGPLVAPGATACRICATVEALNPPLGEHEGAAPHPHGETMGQLLGHLVAMEALKLISGYTPSGLGGRLAIQDLTTFESTLHLLVRLPWCRVCGPGSAPR